MAIGNLYYTKPKFCENGRGFASHDDNAYTSIDNILHIHLI